MAQAMSDEITAPHKLAIRTEGAMVNCYWVPLVSDEMDLHPARIVLSIAADVIAEPNIRAAFQALAQVVSIEVLRIRHGIDPRRVSGFNEQEPGPRGHG
jgi:hypothetical protein